MAETTQPETAQTVESVPVLTKALSTVAVNTAEIEQPIADTDMTPQLETAQETKTSNANARYLRAQFEKRTRLLQEFWTQQHIHITKLNRDHSQLIIILIMSIIGILCSLVAISTNSWICDATKNVCYGIWNTCYLPERTNESIINDQNDTVVPIVKNRIMCAQQELYNIKIDYALQSRIDQVATSQGMIVTGCILYVFSIITMILAYRYINTNNLNSVRNTLVASICVQILAFLMLLIGFFLFIYTDRMSLSVILMFVYFGLAILVSNLINFITIEYKTFKLRQVSI